MSQEKRKSNNEANWCDKSVVASESKGKIFDYQCAAVCNVLSDYSKQQVPESYNSQFPECKFGSAGYIRNRTLWWFILAFVTGNLLSFNH